MNFRTKLCLWAVVIFPFAISSCVSHKELINFNEGPAMSSLPDSVLNRQAIHLQADDILTISVFNSNSTDMEAIAPFNLSAATINNGDPINVQYKIDQGGYIYFPVIGPVKAAGHTLESFNTDLTSRLKRYLQEPVVNSRLINFKITILGEVKVPGTYAATGDHFNILQALGLAGDLTAYAKRDNILVIREQNGKRQFIRMNLRSTESFTSEGFYLQQNDVIYVEPLEQKTYTLSNRGQQILPWVSGSVTLLNLVLIIFTR